MNLQQMKYVIYTAKYNSFSRAAKELFVTQPNVSSAIKDLEKELHIQIFERAKGGVSLTKEGVVLLNQITPIVEQMGFIEDFYSNEKSTENMLNIACQHCMLVSETMAIFLRDYMQTQSYKVHLLEVKTKEVLDYVQTGLCEFGVLLKNRDNKVLAGEIESKNLDFTLLQERKPYVYLSQKHPLADKELITKEDLEPYPYIKYYQGQSSMQFYSEEVVEDHEADSTIIVTDNMTVQTFTNIMNAYTIGSGYKRSGNILADGVSPAVIPYDSQDTIELGLITARGRQLSPLCCKYIQLLREKTC